MNTEKSYGKEYFEGIYAHLKKEKELVFKSFLELLSSRAGPIEKILDLGCGEGDFLKICQRRNIDCFGADISSYALKKAKERVRGEIRKLDLERESLPWLDGFFDVVTALDLVEHLKSPDWLFSEIFRILRRGGIFFSTTPNGGFSLAPLLGKVIPGDVTHVNLQRREYWLAKLRKAGFSKIEVKGCLLFGFPPTLNCRYFLRRLKLPVLSRPIFFPMISLTPELFIFAWKRE